MHCRKKVSQRAMRSSPFTDLGRARCYVKRPCHVVAQPETGLHRSLDARRSWSRSIVIYIREGYFSSLSLFLFASNEKHMTFSYIFLLVFFCQEYFMQIIIINLLLIADKVPSRV